LAASQLVAELQCVSCAAHRGFGLCWLSWLQG
jgi:hypothetical protein